MATLISFNIKEVKSYNLQTAMRKCGYQVKSYKKDRFNKQPRNLYAVQMIDPTLEWIRQKLISYSY